MKIPDNAEKGYKCSQCGMMFTDKLGKGECPFCHHYCTPGDCQLVDTSNEGY
ncbi:MAG: hypothetical protein ACOYVD_14225 [Bacillota bacterium]